MPRSPILLTIPHENKLSSSKATIQAFLPPVTDHLSPLREYWRVNNMLFEFESFLFMIEREEVEAGDVSRVEEFRTRLTSTRELARHCQGKIEFSFSGYDDDPRQLCEIEEVKRYIAILDSVLPELFFFVRTEEPMVTLKLFIFCLFGVGIEGEWPDRRVIIEVKLSAPFLNSHFDSLNLISEWVDLPGEEILRISKAVLKPLGYPPDSAGASEG
jgi:hypothetical protein